MRFLFLLLLVSSVAFSQDEDKGVTLAEVKNLIQQSFADKWYERINLRGYAQIRYNRLGETNRNLKCPACDKSVGDNQGFFLRRGRLVFSGQVSDKVFIYIQPDYGTEAGNQNYLQIRDAYFDYALNQDKSWRVRTGLSKIPYGFANLQSSSNRAPLDRDDAMNTAVPNERDLGVFFIYSPVEIQKRFRDLVSNNLKGSGDYGMFAVGVHNGQGLNKKEENNDLHRFVRLTYPFKLASGRFIETSVQTYAGKYYIADQTRNFLDARQAVSLIIYPQSLGFQAEFNRGQGPEYSPVANKVMTKDLQGGYAQVNYQYNYDTHRFFPYVRYQEYHGGRKAENGALSRVSEWEFGTEWQPNKALEITAAYALSDRLFQSKANDRSTETGNLIRLQAQFNY